jgi:ribosomal protein S6--L-glutamate ligase
MSTKPTVIVLTTSQKDLSDTVQKIGDSCKRMGLKYFPVLTQYAYIDDRSTTRESITINNYDGKGKSVTLDPRDVVCFARGGVTNTQIGMAILTIFENTGMFVINERRPMELCANKLYSAIHLDAYKIPTPRTAFVANLSSLDDALKKIGDKFPVIVKTLTGAEGVGVSKIDSYESLKSVLQTLWKYKAELIIQEYLEIKNDVRVLVLNGKVIAAAMRGKAPKDFRTNLAQGAVGGPYELSDAEKELAERAAEAFGCYYAGVDMVMSGGKPYIIELNSSPGSGNIYRSYLPGSEGDSITGQKLIDAVVRYSVDRSNWNFNHREAGLVETIKIGDLGSFKAKLDTGNESYNVLGAEDIVETDSTVHFSVNGRQYTKPIVSHVRIRTNNIHVERRPVIELDVEFRSREFKNVRFSLVPRRLNKYPVLIGNRFMQVAKISVNVSTRHALPEENHYIQKIDGLTSFSEIEEMGVILESKLAANPADAEQIQAALGHINKAKYRLKNAAILNYNEETTMPSDKDFETYLNETKERKNLTESVRLLIEARKKTPRTPGGDVMSNSTYKKNKYGLFNNQERHRALEKKVSKQVRSKRRKEVAAQRASGQTVKKSRASHQKATHFDNKGGDNGSGEIAAIRFINYRKGNPRRNSAGKPIQTGESPSVVDGNIKGRFNRYYGAKGQRSRTGAPAEAIRRAVAKNIASGKMSEGMRRGLAAGRAKRWAGHKKKGK